MEMGWVLNREARPAAAACGGVGIFDLERRSAERIDEIDDTAAHQIDTHGVDDQLHSVGLGDDVVGVDAFGEPETLGEARTAAAFDRKAQRGVGLALAIGDPADARRGGGREGDFGKLRGHDR